MPRNQYEEWYRANKGFLFDLRERQVFARIIDKKSYNFAVDIGCGTGRITEAISPFVHRVVGVDISLESLGILSAKAINDCSAVCVDLASGTPFRDHPFDLAVSCQVLQHLQYDDLLPTLREVNRILKAQELFVFSGYNFHYWRYKGILGIGKLEPSCSHRFSVEFVQRLADQANFKIQYAGYYKVLPFRTLKHRIWLGIDRFLCWIPWLKRRLSAYIIVVLRKEGLWKEDLK